MRSNNFYFWRYLVNGILVALLMFGVPKCFASTRAIIQNGGLDICGVQFIDNSNGTRMEHSLQAGEKADYNVILFGGTTSTIIVSNSLMNAIVARGVPDGSEVEIVLGSGSASGRFYTISVKTVYSERELFWYGFGTMGVFMGMGLMIRPLRAIGRTWVD